MHKIDPKTLETEEKVQTNYKVFVIKKEKESNYNVKSLI